MEPEHDPLEALLIDDATAAELRAYNEVRRILESLSPEKRTATLITLAYYLDIGPEDSNGA